MPSVFETLTKIAARSKNDQINSMANSIDIPVKSKAPNRAIYTKTEFGKDQTRIPADINKVAAVSPRTGIEMMSKGTSSTGKGNQWFGKNKSQNPIEDSNMHGQLDSYQYRNSIDRKDAAGQGFVGASESKRTPGLGSELKR